MKDLKTDKIACMEIINIVMLFLFSIHFMGGKEKYILVWGVISVVWFGILNKKILWDGDFVVLMVLSILHGIIYKYYYTEISGYTWRQMVFMTFPPLLMYLVCKQIIWQKKQDLVVKVLLIIGYGTFLYSILNFIAFLQEGFYPQGRIWNEFWMRSPRYATEFSYWGVFIVGLLGYALYCFSEKNGFREVQFVFVLE